MSVPLRVVIKDLNIRTYNAHVDTLTGTKLLGAIYAPIICVKQWERFAYIREIRGIDMRNFLLNINNYSPQIIQKFFYSLGIAMAEAHIVGMADRPHNLIVSIEGLQRIPMDRLIEITKRAIINIDRENVLAPGYLNIPVINDIQEVSYTFTVLKNHVQPQHQRIFSEDLGLYLGFYLKGFWDGYRNKRIYFNTHGKSITEKVIKLAGGEFGRRIIERLNLNDEDLKQLIKNIHLRIKKSLFPKNDMQARVVKIQDSSDILQSLERSP